MLFFERSEREKELITLAYEFEKMAIKKGLSTPNPYFRVMKQMGVWEALNEAIIEVGYEISKEA